MILLTGAAGAVGRALLRRLADGDEPVRCLVRDPRRLGADRVRVQIALGDLADRRAHRNAMRGVRVAVHLAASMRDQPRATIEEVNGVATLRLLRAAERAGVEHFVHGSCLGAAAHSVSRLMRAKAAAETVVRASPLPTTIVAPSMIYAPENRWLRLLDGAAAVLPAVPLPGSGAARSEPIWSEDVAACLAALVEGAPTPEPSGHGGVDPRADRVELAGPDEMTLDEVLEVAMAGRGRRRPVVHVPLPIARGILRAGAAALGPAVPVTVDEADLAPVEMITRGGVEHARALGVEPRRMAEVMGVS